MPFARTCLPHRCEGRSPCRGGVAVRVGVVPGEPHTFRAGRLLRTVIVDCRCWKVGVLKPGASPACASITYTCEPGTRRGVGSGYGRQSRGWRCCRPASAPVRRVQAEGPAQHRVAVDELRLVEEGLLNRCCLLEPWRSERSLFGVLRAALGAGNYTAKAMRETSASSIRHSKPASRRCPYSSRKNTTASSAGGWPK